MTVSLDVLLVSETLDKTEMIETMLKDAGYRIDAHISVRDDVLEAVATFDPDIVVVKTESTSNFFMNQLYNLNQENPRPIVIFTDRGEKSLIEGAIKAGVSAYVVDGLSLGRIKPVLDVARARFDQEQSLRSELKKTKSQLQERKTVERAKGIIMQRRNVSEDEAYKALRKMAMDKNQRLIDVASDVISVSELLM